MAVAVAQVSNKFLRGNTRILFCHLLCRLAQLSDHQLHWRWRDCSALGVSLGGLRGRMPGIVSWAELGFRKQYTAKMQNCSRVVFPTLSLSLYERVYACIHVNKYK